MTRFVLAAAACAVALAVPSQGTAECYPNLPSPQIGLTGVEPYVDAFGTPYNRFRIDVTNKAAFPDAMFEAAPDLPACGTNTTASRTWIDIFRGDGSRIYGFCALTSAAQLGDLWFGIPRGQLPPDQVYLTLTDRRCGATYTSNLVSTKVDADGDGLLDVWEIDGLDADRDGTVDVDLPGMGAQVGRKDLFVEIDCLVRHRPDGTVEHSHCPARPAVERVVRGYADANVPNPDGTSGVQLHVDTGGLYGAGLVFSVAGANGVVGTYGDLGAGAALGGGETIDEAGNEIVDWDGAAGNPGTSLFTLKAAHYDARRAFVFRYALFIHQTNARAAANDCTSGWAQMPGDNLMVSLGGTRANGSACWGTDANGFSVGSEAQQAGTLMHEFGHNVGLGHGGLDGVNFKPNYLSVMNYSFQICGVPSRTAAGLPGGCDYSRQELAALYERLQPPQSIGLDECAGVDGGVYGLGAVDFDRSGALQGSTCPAPNTTNVQHDVNSDDACVGPGADGVLQTVAANDDEIRGAGVYDGHDLKCDSAAAGDDVQLKAVGQLQPNPLWSWNDWGSLTYATRAFAAAPGEQPTTPIDPDPESYQAARRNLADLTEPTLTLDLAGPASALPGQTILLSASVANAPSSGSRGPALKVRLSQRRPDGSTQAFDLDLVPLGTAQTRAVQFTVPPDACPAARSASASVSYEDLVGDVRSADASLPVSVLDVVAPRITGLTATPATLWPPDSRTVDVSVAATATDACTPAPTCAISGVSSNEQDRRPQWEIVDGAHVRLLAARDGSGTGRVYAIAVTCTDASGNTASRTAEVRVPHDQRSR